MPERHSPIFPGEINSFPVKFSFSPSSFLFIFSHSFLLSFLHTSFPSFSSFLSLLSLLFSLLPLSLSPSLSISLSLFSSFPFFHYSFVFPAGWVDFPAGQFSEGCAPCGSPLGWYVTDRSFTTRITLFIQVTDGCSRFSYDA